MKKMLTVGLLLLLMLGIGMAAASAETTLMVYMCGTDLQDAACDDIIEMAEAYANDVNILVLAGGANEWDLDGLEGRTRNFAVIRDGEFEELEDWGRGSMGEAESLAEFLEYGLTEYPADRTIVVLWDHGAGSEGGVCFGRESICSISGYLFRNQRNAASVARSGVQRGQLCDGAGLLAHRAYHCGA